ncbi:MFS general substrate transporter [Zopfia rhizophila CBS 207.26]|uniref:MFS general substrate transporter n=1 Tax=Zopfia rhizophila CBS 207.26 TaxID=1314779 RepID=A0A6A6DIT6_9PEZI|nr:MFS general substrate transporter [Zopfia rhizophila CBS 207.26]
MASSKEKTTSNGSATRCAIDPEQPSSPPEDDGSHGQIVYFKGPRLYLIIIATCIAIFLTNLEVPIVTTSLVNITNDFGGFGKAPWIVSSYLLGYVGVVIIFSKISDIFGRKPIFIITLLIFTIFSAACGASQSLTQLIVFRAFQGIGGAGCFALCTIIVIELVPESQYAALTAIISVVYSLALLGGPIVGGAINNSTTWRWVFLLNVPGTVPAILIAYFCIPRNYPHHGNSNYPVHSFRSLIKRKTVKRVDFLGCAMLLLATLSLVAALEEAGLDFGWRSAFVITMLTVSGVLWILFLVWERYVTKKAEVKEPVFPWRFATSRVWIGMLLNAVFLGAPWIGTIFQLPQKFQVVHGSSPIKAGIQLLPFTASGPIGAIIMSIFSKKGVPPIYMVLIASILQVIGFSLLGTLSTENASIRRSQYGFQVIAGFGSGANSALVQLLTPFSVEPRDKAVAMGSIAQFRIMGGAIGLSIVHTAMNGFVKSRLLHLFTNEQFKAIMNSAEAVKSLEPQTRELVTSVLAQGYNLQMKIFAGLASIQIIGTMLMWRRKNIVVPKEM